MNEKQNEVKNEVKDHTQSPVETEATEAKRDSLTLDAKKRLLRAQISRKDKGKEKPRHGLTITLPVAWDIPTVAGMLDLATPSLTIHALRSKFLAYCKVRGTAWDGKHETKVTLDELMQPKPQTREEYLAAQSDAELQAEIERLQEAMKKRQGQG